MEQSATLNAQEDHSFPRLALLWSAVGDIVDVQHTVQELESAFAQLLGEASEPGRAGRELALRFEPGDQEVGGRSESLREAAQHFEPGLTAPALVLADAAPRRAHPGGKIALAPLEPVAELKETLAQDFGQR
jgi:hypothetical protein